MFLVSIVKNFAEFTGKHIGICCIGISFLKIQLQTAAYNFIKKSALQMSFLVIFAKFSTAFVLKTSANDYLYYYFLGSI